MCTLPWPRLPSLAEWSSNGPSLPASQAGAGVLEMPRGSPAGGKQGLKIEGDQGLLLGCCSNHNGGRVMIMLIMLPQELLRELTA